MMSTTNASADGTGSTGTVDTGSGSATSSGGVETTTEPSTSTGSTGATESSSSGEPPADSYPECTADEECPPPYELCWPPKEFGTPNYCTLECGDAEECPVPTSGTAIPVCEGPPDTDICALDCSRGECPDGMSCVDLFGNGAFLRCNRE